jgi:hypothetical protein
MRDKSVQEITEILFPVASHVIVTAPDFARALRPDAVAETAEHPSLEQPRISRRRWKRSVPHRPTRQSSSQGHCISWERPERAS